MEGKTEMLAISNELITNKKNPGLGKRDYLLRPLIKIILENHNKVIAVAREQVDVVVIDGGDPGKVPERVTLEAGHPRTFDKSSIYIKGYPEERIEWAESSHLH